MGGTRAAGPTVTFKVMWGAGITLAATLHSSSLAFNILVRPQCTGLHMLQLLLSPCMHGAVIIVSLGACYYKQFNSTEHSAIQ